MPFQRIVVGVDFSSASLNAVRWLAGTFAPGARIYVVHVIAQPSIPPFLRSHVAADTSDQESALYPGLSAFAGFAGGDPADAIIAHGNPATELARLATALGADLICVGRSRRRRGSGRFGATTPQRLLAQTRIPMLIVPESARVVPGAVLAAVSDGREAADALDVGSALAERWNVRLDALHALEPEVIAFARGTSRSIDDSRLCALAHEWLESLLPDRGMSERQQAIARIGDAGEEVIAHAARNGIGLIVAGRRVRQHATDFAPAEAGVGSTTRLITWATSCPVLVLGCDAPGVRGRPLRGTLRLERASRSLRHRPRAEDVRAYSDLPPSARCSRSADRTG